MDSETLNHLQTWVGQEQTVFDTLSTSPARILAATLDNPIDFNSGDQLPCPWHWLYFLPATPRSDTGEDGHPKKGGFLPPVPLPRRMWAAGSIQIEQPLILGKDAKKTTSIKSVEAKEGKSGNLVFVNLQHSYHQSEELCLTETQNLVYRDAPQARTSLPPGKQRAETPDFSKEICPDPVLLFRYSALTLNSHRIHYDRDYAVDVEFYPALLVHGPLLATLLLDLAYENIPNARLTTFDFRAIRPSFVANPLTVCGKRVQNELQLWSTDHEGNICMTATAKLG